MGYHYYWYHHGMSEGTIESIEDAIDDGDYDKFVEFVQRYPRNLPRRVSFYDDNGNITKDGDILDKEVFLNIVYHEHENG